MGTIDLQLHVRHSKGGLFTDPLFAPGGLVERQKFECEGPHGSFMLDDSDAPVIFIARGVGYAPIRSIILDAFRNNIERPMVFYWGARTPTGLYAMDELTSWAQEYPFFEFVPVVAEPPAGQQWEGRIGQVYEAVCEDSRDISGAMVYACGSPDFVTESKSRLMSEAGMVESRFHADPFITEAELHSEAAITG